MTLAEISGISLGVHRAVSDSEIPALLDCAALGGVQQSASTTVGAGMAVVAGSQTEGLTLESYVERRHNDLYAMVGSVVPSEGATAPLHGSAAWRELARRLLTTEFGDLGGWFVAAHWDSSAQELEVLRDPFGVRTVYYAELPEGGIAFDSRATRLAALPGVSGAPDRETFVEKILNIPSRAGATFFSGVRELPRASILRWSARKGLRVRRYWHLEPDHCVSSAERVELLRSRFALAVKRGCHGLTNPAVTVSGGLDSSSVFRMARAQDVSNLMVINLQDPDYPECDERPFLRAAIEGHVGTMVQVNFRLPQPLSRLIETSEHPESISFSPRSWCSAEHAARAGADCLLGGGHGDRIAGTTDNGWLEMAYLGQWSDLWAGMSSWGFSTRLRHFVTTALSLYVPQIQRRNLARRQFHRSRGQLTSIMGDGIVRTMCLKDRLREDLQELALPVANYATHLEGFLDRWAPYETHAHWNAAWAAVIPFREPFADIWLAKSAASLDLPQRFHDGYRRVAFREAMHGMVPDVVLERRSKANFVQPWLATFADMRAQLDGPRALSRIQELLEFPNNIRARIPTLVGSLPASKMATDLFVCSAWVELHCA